MLKPELIAHWPFRGDVNDVMGMNHGIAHNVSFGKGPDASPESAARFNGRDSVIEVPDSKTLHLGSNDFSIAVWMRDEKPMRSVFGALLHKFDPAQRCGFNFYLASSAPGYNAMSEQRFVHFGLDDGYVSAWEDCGKPWPSNSGVLNLIVYQSQLYCGIADADNPTDAAHVFRWDGNQGWEDCGRLGRNPYHLSVMSMLVHQGRLYAGTGVFDWIRAGGQGFEPALSHVFVYEGGTEWRDLGQVGESIRVLCMASFNDELYVGLDRVGGGHCFKYNGSTWLDCGAPNGDNVQNLLPLGGVLYGATHGMIWRYKGGQEWLCIGDHPFGITQVHCLQAVGGKLHAGTWPQGYVLRYDNNGDWSNIGRLGLSEGMYQCNEINDLTVHNGKLYAGVIPKAQVYRYEADGHWTLLGCLASRPDYADDKVDTWRRVTSLVPYQGKLFASTSACKARSLDVDPDGTLGRVYAVQTGQVVSHERDIGSDWTHLAAVRAEKQLRLYVDGQLSHSSEAPKGHTFDVSNTQPLTIGFGVQNYFCGLMADLRLYRGALNDSQVQALGKKSR
ncbi:LamG domain-containing protein [Candidatus Poribacteria bacterium]|nr:LamG domain-containing protein [Candidatus Poribacteria bacterium]